MTYDDPIDDTMPGANNLMENGTVLTPGQAFALTRSALLESAPRPATSADTIHPAAWK